MPILHAYIIDSNQAFLKLFQAVSAINSWKIRPVWPSVVLRTSAPAKRSFRGSITRPARSLISASPRRLPDATQDSLPVGGQPLPSGTDHPPGSSSPFHVKLRLTIPSDQAFLAHQDPSRTLASGECPVYSKPLARDPSRAQETRTMRASFR